MEITPLAPPSVQLVPAKEYNGAPIGTSYDVRAYVAERIDEKLHKRTTVRMGIRVVQRAFAPPSPYQYVPGGGKTSKEQAKMNRKALLFGCKSEPFQNRLLTNQDTENKSPNRRFPLKYSGRVTFDEQEDDSITITQNSVEINGKSTDAVDSEQTALEKRRASLKTTKSEVRSDSVESNEDRISDYYRSLCSAKRPSMAAYLAAVPNPEATVEKQFLLSDGKVILSATLDKGIYSHGEEIRVSVQIRNNSSKTVRRIKVFVVQHVDVCMFSNGKFKNVVALLSDKESCPILTAATLSKTYTLLPLNSTTKNWIALEDTYTKSSSSLASTVCSVTGNADDRNVFAIYVSYYVK
ncbi:hypothetical protein YQE_01673, partial [Dendroctonus ponderosae]